MKVLGSWCDDSGGRTGALVASLRTGNSAFYKYEALLNDRKLSIVGRTKGIRHCLRGLDVARLGNASLGQCQS